MDQMNNFTQQNLQAQSAGIPVDWQKAYQILHGAAETRVEQLKKECQELAAELAEKTEECRKLSVTG